MADEDVVEIGLRAVAEMGVTDWAETLRAIEGDGGQVFGIGGQPERRRAAGAGMIDGGLQQGLADPLAMMARLHMERCDFQVGAACNRRGHA